MLMRVDAHDTKGILSRRELLLTPVLLAACSREATHQRVDPALAPLIPPDTTSLIGVRVDHLRNTPAWPKLFPPNGEIALEKLKAQTGLDLRTGLYEAIYCIGPKHRIALIRGKFVDGGITNAGLEPELKIEGAVKFPYKGFTLVGQEEHAVTFLNSSVFIAGRASAIRAVIDNRELKNAIPKPLLALVDTMPPTAHCYFATARPTIPEGGIAGIQSLPLSLNTVKAWVDFSTQATLHAEAVGPTPDDAKKLEEGLKAMASIARMTDPKNLGKTLDTVQWTLDGNTLRMTGELPMDVLVRSLSGLDPLTAGK